jgi:hypothetical protein
MVNPPVIPLEVPTQVALWDEPKRAMPVAFARGALFRAAAKGERRMINGPIATTPDVTIQYAGQELRTNDEELLMFLVHQLRGKSTKDPEQLKIKRTRHDFLRMLERPVSAEYYTELESSLDRMAQGTLNVQYRSANGRKYKLTQSIIRKVAIEDKDGPNPMWTVWVEPEILKFFGHQDDYYEISWKERVRLGRPQSKWLHSYLNSLRFRELKLVSLTVSELWKLSGSETAHLKSFKVVLKRALVEMEQEEVIGSWSITGDILLCSAPGFQDLDPSRAIHITLFDTEEAAV